MEEENIGGELKYNFENVRIVPVLLTGYIPNTYNSAWNMQTVSKHLWNK